MLGRKTYTAVEIARSRAMVAEALAAAPADSGPALWNAVLLALDRTFVHRVRAVTGKDTNPASELEMLVDALLLHDGVLTASSVVRYDQAKACLGLGPGDRVELSRSDLERFAVEFHEHMETRFLDDA